MVLRAIAGSGAALSGASAVHISIFGLTPVVKFGSDEQKQRTCRRSSAAITWRASG